MSAALVWCPFPDEDEAAALAGRLLDEGLIVCANLLPAMRSLYRWNGERGGRAGDITPVETLAACGYIAIAIHSFRPVMPAAIVAFSTTESRPPWALRIPNSSLSCRPARPVR